MRDEQKRSLFIPLPSSFVPHLPIHQEHTKNIHHMAIANRKIGNWIDALGRRAIDSANRLMDLCALTYRLTDIALPLPKKGRSMIKRVIIEQIYFTAVQALPVIIPIALIIGSTLIVQFSQLSGQVDLGKLVVLLVLREIGSPSLRPLS